MNKITILVGLFVMLVATGLAGAIGVENLTADGIWLNGTRMYINLNYTGNDTITVDVLVVLHYATHIKQFAGTATLFPNSINQVYINLDTGYLKYLTVFVNGTELTTRQINTMIFTGDYGVHVDQICNETVVNSTCTYKVIYYYPELTQYGVMWSYDNETWNKKDMYANTDYVVLDSGIKPTKTGTLYVKFFLKVDDVYMYSTKTYTVKVDPNYTSQNYINPVASYGYENMHIWREYKYNPLTDYTMIITHIDYEGSEKTAEIILTDWLPPTLAPSLNSTYLTPTPKFTHRHLSYDLKVEKGKDTEILWVIRGRARPDLVAQLPAPTVIYKGEVLSQLVKRVYHIGNITVIRTLQYMPDINKTVIVTNITGLNSSNTYIIMDKLPGYTQRSEITVIPEESNYSVSDNSLVLRFNVSDTETFGYIYRLPGHISPAYIDALGTPSISTAVLTNETNATSVVVHKTPLTGLISLLESGSITYASIILTAAILAFLAFMAETRKPVPITEISEEEAILAEME